MQRVCQQQLFTWTQFAMLKTVILIICWANLATWFPIIFGIASYTIEFTVDFDSTAYVSHRMGMNVILDYMYVMTVCKDAGYNSFRYRHKFCEVFICIQNGVQKQ